MPANQDQAITDSTWNSLTSDEQEKLTTEVFKVIGTTSRSKMDFFNFDFIMRKLSAKINSVKTDVVSDTAFCTSVPDVMKVTALYNARTATILTAYEVMVVNKVDFEEEIKATKDVEAVFPCVVHFIRFMVNEVFNAVGLKPVFRNSDVIPNEEFSLLVRLGALENISKTTDEIASNFSWIAQSLLIVIRNATSPTHLNMDVVVLGMLYLTHNCRLSGHVFVENLLTANPKALLGLRGRDDSIEYIMSLMHPVFHPYTDQCITDLITKLIDKKTAEVLSKYFGRTISTGRLTTRGLALVPGSAPIRYAVSLATTHILPKMSVMVDSKAIKFTADVTAWVTLAESKMGTAVGVNELLSDVSTVGLMKNISCVGLTILFSEVTDVTRLRLPPSTVTLLTESVVESCKAKGAAIAKKRNDDFAKAEIVDILLS